MSRPVVLPKRVVCVARFEGRCARCDTIIDVGDRIEKVLGGWMHEGCPADPPDDAIETTALFDDDVGDRR